MTDPTARNLIQRLTDALKEECNWIDNPKHDGVIAEALVYLENTEPPEQISEEENEVRFKACMEAISDLKHGEITELMGEAFMEEFKRVSQR